jgi:hypothetical protein
MNLNNIINLFKPSGSKDPNDYKKDSLSTDWESDDHYCSICKRSTKHNEYMSDICNGCGGFNTQVRYGRCFRKIYIDGKWRIQIKYRNGDNCII